MSNIPMKDTRDYITPQEHDKIISSMRNERDVLLFTMLYKTGRRISELVGDKLTYSKGLTVQDINFDDDLINYTILKKKPKSAEKRTEMTPIKAWLPVQHDVILMLAGYISRHNITDRVFKITRQRADQILRRHVKAAGITRNIHLHQYRHSFAIRFGATMTTPLDIERVSNQLQHSNIKMTLWYFKTFGDKDTKDKLDKV